MPSKRHVVMHAGRCGSVDVRATGSLDAGVNSIGAGQWVGDIKCSSASASPVPNGKEAVEYGCVKTMASAPLIPMTLYVWI